MKSTCPDKTFQMDVTLDSTISHGLIAYSFKAKQHSSNAATCNMEKSQTLSKNIQCVIPVSSFMHMIVQLHQQWNVDRNILLYMHGEEVVP